MRLLLLFVFLPFLAEAQVQHTRLAQQPGTTVQVATIEEMEQHADSAVQLLVTDNARGGLFHYSIDNTGDGGTRFTARGVGHGSWQRLYDQSATLNVKWFGAKGDAHTSDLDALQKAVEVAAASKIPLLLPAGKYFLPSNTTLALPANIHLKGVGVSFTSITTDTGFNGAYPSLIRTFGDNVVLEDITFSGGRASDGGNKSAAESGRYSILNISFDVKPTYNITIQRCRFMDAFGRAIVYRASHMAIRDCIFERIGRYNIDFARLDGAISNFGRTDCADISIERNRFEYIGTHCIASYKTDGLKIRDNYLDYISGIGLAHQQCSNVEVSGNTLNHTGDNGIDFQRCERVVINNNYFNNAGDKNAGNAGSAAAIFVGDDYGLAASSSTIISNNFVTGTFNYKNKNSQGPFQNCGFYIIDANHVKITNNIIRYIGALPADTTAAVLEDGNGIMIVNTKRGSGTDIVIEGNTLSNLKSNGIYVNGQSRELKIKNNYIDKFGTHGILLSAIGTNLFSQVEGNTIVDGTNFYHRPVAADIYVEAANAWITNFNLSRNQLRNDSRGSYKSRNDTVFTTHGIYFNALGFGKFNNLLVSDNQMNGHLVDEIGFSENISEYSITKENYFPLVSFKNNFSGSTDDQPDIIIPGLNQPVKPKIITESYGVEPPSYGNYSAGSTIKNIYPQNDVYGWVAANSGFAASMKWKSGTRYVTGQTVYVNEEAFRCKVAGISGKTAPVKSDQLINDGQAKWEFMGDKVVFKKVLLRELR
jgi:polygalacturonase